MVPALDTFGNNKRPTPIVTHVTEVKIPLLSDNNLLPVPDSDSVTPASVRQAGDWMAEHYRRAAAMMDLLARHGFTFRAEKKVIHCYSSEMEAGDTKRLLGEAGFKDREYQIVLEYTRGWGML